MIYVNKRLILSYLILLCTFILVPLSFNNYQNEEFTPEELDEMTYETEDESWKEYDNLIVSEGTLYRVWKYAGDRIRNANLKNSSICLATHSTLNSLYWIAETSNLWGGIVSVAVFTPIPEIATALHSIEMLRKCSPTIRHNVTFTLLHPALDSEDISIKYSSKEDEINCDFFITSFVTDVLEAESYMADIVYPQNLMRNMARSMCPTSYTLNIDMDMIPNRGLANDLTDFLERTPLCFNCAFIVPVYEIAKNSTFPPVNKAELLQKLERFEAQRYHVKVFEPNQSNSNLSKWENLPSKSDSELNILYKIRTYQEYWEPILVLHSSAPRFNERFIGYGFTRNSHIYLLQHLYFTFYVLDNAFLSHYGFQSTKVYSKRRRSEVAKNQLIYKKFKNQLLGDLRETRDKGRLL